MVKVRGTFEEECMVEARRVSNVLNFDCSCRTFFERLICPHIVALSIWKPYPDMRTFGVRSFRLRRTLGRPALATRALTRQ